MWEQVRDFKVGIFLANARNPFEGREGWPERLRDWRGRAARESWRRSAWRWEWWRRVR